MSLSPGQILHRYNIREEVGRGAFGVVYWAYDQKLHDDVAIKEFNTESAARFGDPRKMRERFMQEARITRKLKHSHIVEIYDLFEANETSYIVMPYLPDTLAKRLEAKKYLPVAKAIPIMQQICEGLAYAHTFRTGQNSTTVIVHCDIKPGNILFDQANNVKITDFGIAHVSHSEGAGMTLSTDGFHAGTVFYMSPEQVDGVRDDPRIDVYALSALFYQVLTGRYYLDFDTGNSNTAQARNILSITGSQPIIPPLRERNVPEPLIEIILKALSKEPHYRYTNAGEMLIALEKRGSENIVHLPTEAMQVLPDFGKKYHFIKQLGQGGFATVYQAVDTTLDREVAIKVLHRSLLESDLTFPERFLREAKTLARLKHPHIIDIYEIGEHRGQPFIVMPYLPGPTLANLIAQQGALNPTQVIRLTNQIADALDYAHQQGVIHRDVKPANILLDEHGQAILTDFSIVKLINESMALTRTGLNWGTPQYIAPEQWTSGQVDARTDLYALGVLLYQLLTGHTPFDGETPQIMYGHVNKLPPSPQSFNPALPPVVETVLRRALTKEPNQRYQTGCELAQALQAALTTQFKPTKPYWVMPGGSVGGAVGGGIILLLGFLLILLLKLPPVPTPTPTSTFLPSPSMNTPAATHTLRPTATDTQMATHLLTLPTATPTIEATPLPSPIPTEIPRLPTFTPNPTDTPTSTSLPTQNTLPSATPTSLPTGQFILLKPNSIDGPSFGPTEFRWQWSSPLEPNQGFEIRVWREGEPPAGAHNAVEDNQKGNVAALGENTYRLNINIRDAEGVKTRSGDYLWTVLLVQIAPEYKDLGIQAPPGRFRFEAGGRGGGNSDGGGGGPDIQ